MSERRNARHSRASTGAVWFVGNELPPEMAIGPCIEVWADRGQETSPVAWFRAHRNWSDAVVEWAERTGWAREGRPAANAHNLARTRLPWSRAFLITRGEREVVDYFEGHGDAYPDRLHSGWNPNH